MQTRDRVDATIISKDGTQTNAILKL